jgi:hypothetical protein
MDMNRVFEDFVVVALREALRVSERAFPQGARGRRLFLDSDRRVSLEPDISWWEGGSCAFVGDIKYKALSKSGIDHSDLYQLLAYVIACHLPGGLLIYGSGEKAITHDIVRAGRRLEVVSLNLSDPPERILQSTEDLADVIKAPRANTAKVGGATLQYQAFGEHVKKLLGKVDLRNTYSVYEEDGAYNVVGEIPRGQRYDCTVPSEAVSYLCRRLAGPRVTAEQAQDNAEDSIRTFVPFPGYREVMFE